MEVNEKSEMVRMYRMSNSVKYIAECFGRTVDQVKEILGDTTKECKRCGKSYEFRDYIRYSDTGFETRRLICNKCIRKELKEVDSNLSKKTGSTLE